MSWMFKETIAGSHSLLVLIMTLSCPHGIVFQPYLGNNNDPCWWNAIKQLLKTSTYNSKSYSRKFISCRLNTISNKQTNVNGQDNREDSTGLLPSGTTNDSLVRHRWTCLAESSVNYCRAAWIVLTISLGAMWDFCLLFAYTRVMNVYSIFAAHEAVASRAVFVIVSGSGGWKRF